MVEIVVSYHSGSGHTQRLVEIFTAELEACGATTHIADVEALSDSDWEAMRRADGHVFAAPTYMGSVSAPYKAFMDASSVIWGSDADWRGKMAGAMTVATHPSGDKMGTLTQLAIFAAQHRMLWVGVGDIGAPVKPELEGINTDGIWLGLGATSVRDKSQMVRAGDEITTRNFARRFHEATARWVRGGA